VTVSVSGFKSGTTNGSGLYTITGIPEFSAVTVKAAKKGYVFDPAFVDTVVAADQETNFSAVPLYTVRGRILDAGGKALSRVVVSLSGSVTATATTNSSGDFTFAGLPATGSYSITPALAGYVFSPESAQISDLPGDVQSDFRGTKQ
jgi:hypothetical protein